MHTYTYTHSKNKTKILNMIAGGLKYNIEEI